MESCDTCLFWREHNDTEYGECRRSAPATAYGHRYERVLAAILKGVDGYIDTSAKKDRMERHAEWPYTTAFDFCGEWKGRGEKKA